jgi:outer membrane scaffolding protein for murein synthesis (MipA/OmpV family)
MMKTSYVSLALLAAIVAAPAAAQDGPPRDFVALGVGVAPEYPGADDYAPIPFGAARLTTPYAVLSLEGPALRADVAGPLFGRGFSGGPVLRYRGGRSDVENAAVDALPDVDDAVEVGGFVGYGLPGPLGDDGVAFTLEAVADVADGHDGFVVTPRVSYGVPIGASLRVNIGAAATIGDGDYTDAFFGVTPAGAAASGLDAYDAGSGLTAVGIAFGADYAITRDWGVYGQVAWTRLVGDAADSPVVESEDGFVAGLALRYSF